MKKLMLTASILIAASSIFAQKATGTKQDEILVQQKQVLEKQSSSVMLLEQILEKQNELTMQYGNKFDLEKEDDKMSYAYGQSLAENLKAQGVQNINIAALNKGMIDVLTGGKTEMTIQEAQGILNTYFGKLAEAKAAVAREAGEKFLAENGKRPEVKTTASGLQYEVLKKGDGEKPKATDKVTVHYHGTLITGEVFDSSVDRGKPASFGLNQVIKGWTEGVQLMSVGAKYRFYIPSDLAYGERGAGSMIGPHQALVFEVELISID